VEKYCKEQGLFRTDDTPDPEFTDTIALDLTTVEPSRAGPKRPQDRVPLRQAKPMFRDALKADLERLAAAAGKPDVKRATVASAAPAQSASSVAVAPEQASDDTDVPVEMNG